MTAARSRSWSAPSLFVLVTCSLSAALPAAAEVRGGETVLLEEGEILDENLYASGGTVAIRGDVRGDVVVAGGTVLITGAVRGDVLAAGGQVTISGRVLGDVRAAGGQVSLLAPVDGDAVLAGGDVHVGGAVRGDVLLTGGTAALTASISGEVRTAAGETRIASTVVGDVSVQGGTLALESGARLGGDLDFTGPRALERDPGSHVAGTITQRRAPTSDEGGIGALLYGWLQVLTGLFVLGLVLLLVFPRFTDRAMDALRAHPGKSLGLGVAALLGVPIVIGLVFFLGTFVGGAWLGFVGLTVYGVALLFTVPLVAASLTLALVRRARRREATASWWQLLLGLVVLTLLFVIPFVGPLLLLATVLFGLGALVLSWLGTVRATSRERRPAAGA